MPTKHIRVENALIGVGGEILAYLDRDKPISVLFHDVQARRAAAEITTIEFDWFLLALDFLFLIGAIQYDAGLIKRATQ